MLTTRQDQATENLSNRDIFAKQLQLHITTITQLLASMTKLKSSKDSSNNIILGEASSYQSVSAAILKQLSDLENTANVALQQLMTDLMCETNEQGTHFEILNTYCNERLDANKEKQEKILRSISNKKDKRTKYEREIKALSRTKTQLQKQAADQTWVKSIANPVLSLLTDKKDEVAVINSELENIKTKKQENKNKLQALEVKKKAITAESTLLRKLNTQLALIAKNYADLSTSKSIAEDFVENTKKWVGKLEKLRAEIATVRDAKVSEKKISDRKELLDALQSHQKQLSTVAQKLNQLDLEGKEWHADDVYCGALNHIHQLIEDEKSTLDEQRKIFLAELETISECINIFTSNEELIKTIQRSCGKSPISTQGNRKGSREQKHLINKMEMIKEDIEAKKELRKTLTRQAEIMVSMSTSLAEMSDDKHNSHLILFLRESIAEEQTKLVRGAAAIESNISNATKIVEDLEKTKKENQESDARKRKSKDFIEGIESLTSTQLASGLKEADLPNFSQALPVYVRLFSRVAKLFLYDSSSNVAAKDVAALLANFNLFLKNHSATLSDNETHTQIMAILRDLQLFCSCLEKEPTTLFVRDEMKYLQKLLFATSKKSDIKLAINDILVCVSLGIDVHQGIKDIFYKKAPYHCVTLDMEDIINLLEAASTLQDLYFDDVHATLCNQLILEKHHHTLNALSRKLEGCESVRDLVCTFAGHDSFLYDDCATLAVYDTLFRCIYQRYSEKKQGANIGAIIRKFSAFLECYSPENENASAQHKLLIHILSSINSLQMDLPASAKLKIKTLLRFDHVLEASDHIGGDLRVCAIAGLDIADFVVKMASRLPKNKVDLVNFLYACFLRDANSGVPGRYISGPIIKTIFAKIEKRYQAEFQYLNTTEKDLNSAATSRVMEERLYSNKNERFSDSDLKTSREALYILEAAAFYKYNLDAAFQKHLAHIFKFNSKATISAGQRALFRFLRDQIAYFAPHMEITLETDHEVFLDVFGFDLMLRDPQTKRTFDLEFDGDDFHFYRNADFSPSDISLRKDTARDAAIRANNCEVIRFTRRDLESCMRSRSGKLAAFIAEILPQQDYENEEASFQEESSSVSSGSQYPEKAQPATAQSGFVHSPNKRPPPLPLFIPEYEYQQAPEQEYQYQQVPEQYQQYPVTQYPATQHPQYQQYPVQHQPSSSYPHTLPVPRQRSARGQSNPSVGQHPFSLYGSARYERPQAPKTPKSSQFRKG